MNVLVVYNLILQIENVDMFSSSGRK